jgi:biopolymer transport protein ExbB
MAGRFWHILTVLGLAAAAGPAFGQPVGGTGQGTSILQIFWQGIEIPTYFIVAGSAVVVALVVEHFLTIRRASIAPDVQVRKAKSLIEARNFRDCLERMKKSSTFFAQVMTAALLHARHGFDAMHDAGIEKAGELSGRMFRKAEYLNILGNLGPLLGLLGTVWGMIEAFGELGAAGGQASAGQLAAGISKALVNTLLGLALAIVGLGFFGLCRNRIDSLTVSATVDALDLLEYFRAPGAARAADAATPSASMPTPPITAVAPRPAEVPGLDLGPASSPT